MNSILLFVFWALLTIAALEVVSALLEIATVVVLATASDYGVSWGTPALHITATTSLPLRECVSRMRAIGVPRAVTVPLAVVNVVGSALNFLYPASLAQRREKLLDLIGRRVGVYGVWCVVLVHDSCDHWRAAFNTRPRFATVPPPSTVSARDWSAIFGRTGPANPSVN